MNPARKLRTALATAGAMAVGMAAFHSDRASAGGAPTAGALTYSGTLEDGTGAPLAGRHNLRVTFWSTLTGGTSMCQTASSEFALDAGRFSIPLPDTCAASVKASPNVWSEVEVDGAPLQRTKIGAVPYAVEASHATMADTATSVVSVSNWADYTATASSTAASATIAATSTGKWRRVGDSVEVNITTHFTQCTGGGAMRWSLPPGLLPDTTKLTYPYAHIGFAFVGGGTASSETAVGIAAQQGEPYVAADPLYCNEIVSGSFVRLMFTMPIKGWSAAPSP